MLPGGAVLALDCVLGGQAHACSPPPRSTLRYLLVHGVEPSRVVGAVDGGKGELDEEITALDLLHDGSARRCNLWSESLLDLGTLQAGRSASGRARRGVGSGSGCSRSRKKQSGVAV